MTKLTNPVLRECVWRDGGRPIVVGLEPGDLITFRRKGTRRQYALPISAAYAMAVKAHVAAEERTNGKPTPQRRTVRRGKL